MFFKLLIVLLVALIYGLLLTLINPEYRECFWLKNKKLNEVQKAWDEYIKDMALSEQLDIYNQWTQEYMFKHHNECLWLPRMHSITKEEKKNEGSDQQFNL